MLSHRVLDSKLYEPEKEEWKYIQKLAKNNEELKNKLAAAKERIATLERVMPEEKTSQSNKRRAARRESSSGDKGGKIKRQFQVRSPAYKEEK